MTQVKEDPVATASGNGKMPDDVQRGARQGSRDLSVSQLTVQPR